MTAEAAASNASRVVSPTPRAVNRTAVGCPGAVVNDLPSTVVPVSVGATSPTLSSVLTGGSDSG